MRRRRSPPSTAAATWCSRRAPRPTRRCAARHAPASGSAAGTAGSTSTRFDPAKRDAGPFPGEVNVLYVGRLTKEKGADLLADAFLAARERDPRLHLCLAGGGPEEQRCASGSASHATFLGWLEGEELARAYASADLFLFASRTDTFGQVLLEAQASGLPVVAVAEGGPASMVEDGDSGLLARPTRTRWPRRCCGWPARPCGAGLAAGRSTAVRERTWEAR